MRTGISIALKPADRRRLASLARDRNAPHKQVLSNGSGARMVSSRTGSGSSSSSTTRSLSTSCAMLSGPMSIRPPGLPMKKGRAGTITHDYKRHGTTTLFAALDVLEGKVIGRCMQCHRHQEFIRFLNAIEAQVSARKLVHVILDNYAVHKHPKVRLPLHANLVLVAQCSRGVLRQTCQAATKARVFRGVVDLQATINRFVAQTNQHPKPFIWTADPDKIIAAVRRGHQVLDSVH
jgi:DDE superfamily endonuclease